MHGIGNDFVVLDGIRDPIPSLLPELAESMCDRRYGVGGDGLIVFDRGETAPFRMRMWNPDGSEGGMCGNGTRCMMVLAERHHHATGSFEMEVADRITRVERVSRDRIRVDMGIAGLTREAIGMIGEPHDRVVKQPIGGYLGTASAFGNPHLVIFVEDVEAVDLGAEGKRLEHEPSFPNRTNVHFAQLERPNLLIQRTWERGAGATLACGSGACAVAVASRLEGLTDSDVTIRLPGGTLSIEIDDAYRVWMTGDATHVFDAIWPT